MKTSSQNWKLQENTSVSLKFVNTQKLINIEQTYTEERVKLTKQPFTDVHFFIHEKLIYIFRDYLENFTKAFILRYAMTIDKKTQC